MKKTGVLVLWGLAVLLAGSLFSCEKEGVLERSGEKVAVNISLGDVFYSGNETVTRGDAEEAEAVRVSLGEGLFMYTRIEKNLEAEMRAGEALEDGVMVRVVAYNGSAVEGTVEYTVVNGALTTSTALEVYTETPYTFVAYSYNSAVSPTYPGPTITVDPANDLLYGKESKTITATDNSVYITMSHQFAQVKVKARTTFVSGRPDIKALSGVAVTPGNPLDLTIETGAVAKNAAAAMQTVSGWSAFNDSVVTSAPITVYTGTANPIYLNINSVTIDGHDPFTGIKVAFKKALEVGYSYTLVVNFQKTDWAKSNIYWKSTGGNTGYLTFDTNENGHQGYQGVQFKWGSLVGISPAGAALSPYSSSIVTYTLNAIVTGTYSTWASIPYESNAAVTVVGAPNPSTLKGDICEQINSAYRLPLNGEFGGNDGWGQNSWEKYENSDFAAVATDKDDGTYDFIANGKSCAKNTAMGDVIFPASGGRNSGGTLYEVGNSGMLRSGSGSADGESYILYFVSTDVFPQRKTYRYCSYSVRCVRK